MWTPRRAALVPLLAASALIPRLSTAQGAPDDGGRLTAAQVRRDLTILRRTLDALHPGLHRYTTPAAFDSVWTAETTPLAAGATRAQLYLAVTRIAAAIRCGHTWTNPLNQRDDLREALFGRATALPVQLRLIDDRFLVVGSIADGVADGDELLAIDGMPAATIVATMLPYLRADGAADGKRRIQLSHASGESALDLVYPLVRPPRAAGYELTVRSPGGTARTVVAAAVRRQARDSLLAARGRPRPSDAWTLELRADTAIMVLPTFVARDAAPDWRGWLRSAFDTLAARRTRILVLDLRRNEGGDGALVDSVVAHLIASPWSGRTQYAETAYERVPYQLARYLETWDYGFFDRTGRVLPSSGRTARLRGREARDVQLLPATPHFDGRVFALIGPENSSAGFLMARRLRETRTATLVGEPTGGNWRGLNAGEIAWVVLPASGVAVDVPLLAFVDEGAVPDGGVEPDIRPTGRFDAIRAGRDPDLDAIRTLLRRERRRR